MQLVCREKLLVPDDDPAAAEHDKNWHLTHHPSDPMLRFPMTVSKKKESQLVHKAFLIDRPFVHLARGQRHEGSLDYAAGPDGQAGIRLRLSLRPG
jgi:hypothetical protein